LKSPAAVKNKLNITKKRKKKISFPKEKVFTGKEVVVVVVTHKETPNIIIQTNLKKGKRIKPSEAWFQKIISSLIQNTVTCCTEVLRSIIC
jgi:aspartate/glutamate racemase